MGRPVWRLIADPPMPGPRNMAVDAAILGARSCGRAPATLRLYAWSPPAVSLGRFQDPGGVDLDACTALGWDVVRRPTGGRGVVHRHEVTYAVIASTDDGVPPGTAASYRFLCAGLLKAYGHLGVEAGLTAGRRGSSGAACYTQATRADVSAGTAKLSGSAQVWRHDHVLQHGSVVIARDVASEARVFRLGDAGRQELEDAATSLTELLGSPPGAAEIQLALERGFSEALGVSFERGGLSVGESSAVEALEHRYRIQTVAAE